MADSGSKEQTYDTLLNKILSSISDVMVIASPEGKITFKSPNIEKHFGWKPEDLIGKELLVNVHPEDTKAALESYKTMIDNPGLTFTLECRYRCKDGSYKWIQFNGTNLIHDSDINGVLGSYRDITERVNAEQSIKKKDSMYRELFHNLTSGISVFKVITNTKGKPIDYRFISINTAYEKSIGCKESDLVGKSFLEVYPRTEKVWLDAIEEVYLTGEPITLKNYAQEVKKHYELVVYRPQKDMIALIGKDITDQIEAEQNFIESEQRLKALHNASFGGIAIHQKGIILDCNNSLSEITGYSYDELIGMNGLLLIAEQDRDFVMSNIQSGFEKPYEATGQRKNGKEYPLRLEARNIPYKGESVRSVEFRDITQQKTTELEIIKAKERAEESELFLKESQRTGKIGSYKLNFETGSFHTTETIDTLLGIPPSYEKNIANWFDIIHPEDRQAVQDYFNNEVIAKKQPFQSEYRIIRKNDNVTRWMQGAGKLLFDEQGNLTYMLGTIQDVTKRKEYEQQILEKSTEYESLNEELRQANEELLVAKEKAEEASRLKTEFLNNMSHEIRTPLNGIIGFSELLNTEGKTPQQRLNFSKIIQNSSHQLLRIIEDILEISTIEVRQYQIQKEVFCLNELLLELHSIFNLKSKERNIPFHIKKGLNDEESQILSDKTKLNRILGNLIENAIKFTYEGFIEVGYYIQDEKLVLYVKDTGIGISPKNHDIIFERFSQEEKDISRTHGGLGLGLSISKENAQLLGGNITLESEKGKGTTFYVAIPYMHAIATETPIHKSEVGSEKNKNLSILIAEDEEINYLYFEAIFEDEDSSKYKLFHARDGKEAVDICKENRDIDIILMDIKMPIMNGYQATEQIRTFLPDLPIIAQTAYFTEADKALALKHGCNDFITKPINREKFFELMNTYISKE